MNHKGVDYTVVRSDTPGFWQWRFSLGNTVKTGKTETSLKLLAMRRVQLRIDQALKEVEQTGAF
jgi:hypothetical protein